MIKLRLTRLKIMCILPILISLIGCDGGNKEVQGYIEGRFTYVAADAEGILKALLVERGNQVTLNQKLFVLDQQPESDLLLQSKRRVEQSVELKKQAEADLVYSTLTLERYKTLVAKGAIDKASLDSAQNQYDRDKARVAQNTASLAESESDLAKNQWSLEQKTVFAPIAGEVFDTYYRTGELVANGTPVLSILAPENIKVIFYVHEKLLARIHLGDIIHFKCNECEKAYRGTISFISPDAEYTPPVIFSTDTTYKLIYRIEARLSPDVAFKQHPGQPVMVTINGKAR